MKQRIITGIILAIAFIGLLQWGGIPFAILILLLAAVGMYEFLHIHGYPAFDAAGWTAMLAILAVAFPWQSILEVDLPAMELVLWLFIFILLSITVITKNKIHIQQVAIVLIGILYIGIGFHYMSLIRLEYGIVWAYLIFGCTIITDVGAYFTGWSIGKRPLWPAISPKKTVEGALGGIVFSIILAIVLSGYLPHSITWLEAASIGLIISAAGQLGDLIQSAYKRMNQVKDSGTIFPGHGGVLDRCDSWLIVFPLMHFVLLELLPS